MTRLGLATALLVLVVAVPAAARPPGGDWTFVRKDSYVHYACKRDRGDDFVVKTAAWFNGKGQMIKEYPAWANLADGPRSDIRSKFTRNWVGGFAFLKFKDVSGSDRLWLQADGYGPPDVWGDGIRVARLTECAG